MKTYVFGDSYSVEFDNPYLHPPGHEYCNWKGYTPKKYFHLLTEKFGSTEILNFALSGNDNDNIFEKFTEIYPQIEPDDLVIFGWTAIGRFSICNNREEGDTNMNLWGSSVSYNNFEWVEKTSQNRSTSLYYDRMMKLITFINNVLKNNKVVHWTWIYKPELEFDETTIKTETKGVVNDFHYNEKAHLELYNKMVNEFKSSNHISVDLWADDSYMTENLALKKTS